MASEWYQNDPAPVAIRALFTSVRRVPRASSSDAADMPWPNKNKKKKTKQKPTVEKEKERA